MSHAPFGDDVIGKFPYVFAGSFQNRHFHAAFVVQVNVKRGLRQIMMIVEIASESLWKLALVMVVDVNQSGKTRSPPCRLHCVLLEARPRQVAYRLRSIGVTARRHVTLQLSGKIIVDGYCDTLHCCSLRGGEYDDLLTSSYQPINLSKTGRRKRPSQ